MLDLPPDAVLEVMRYLDFCDVCALLQVCKATSGLRTHPCCFTEWRVRRVSRFEPEANPGVHPSRAFLFARHLGSTRAALREVNVEVSVLELDVLQYVLQEANTTRLGVVHVSLTPPLVGEIEYGPMSRGLLLSRDAGRALNDNIACANAIAEFSALLSPGESTGISGWCARSCPAVTSLTLRNMPDLRHMGGVPRMKNLTHLEAPLDAAVVTLVLEELPRLTHLTLPHVEHPMANSDLGHQYSEQALELASSSLQVLDISAFPQGTSPLNLTAYDSVYVIYSVDCPALRQIRCGPYGRNGLLVSAPGGGYAIPEPRAEYEGSDAPCKLVHWRLIRIMHPSLHPDRAPPVSLPEDCVVLWRPPFIIPPVGADPQKGQPWPEQPWLEVHKELKVGAFIERLDAWWSARQARWEWLVK